MRRGRGGNYANTMCIDEILKKRTFLIFILKIHLKFKDCFSDGKNPILMSLWQQLFPINNYSLGVLKLIHE